LNLYYPILEFLQELWRPLVDLIADVVLPKHDTELGFLDEVQSYSHVWFDKRRYGASEEHRGQSARYAYIDHRIPVEIQCIFKIDRKSKDGSNLSATCAVVRRFRPNMLITDFPWDLHAIDLGVAVWSADALGDNEVVDVHQLSGHLILVPITVQTEPLWVTVAFDH
ncbi:hypothetical protein C8F01DRAFT_969210, partial [Mycena amicta]